MKTRMVSKQTAQRNWVVMDVKDKVLGRAATQIASMLRGKHKPTFTPHADTGDFVVVVNAEKVRLTGNKWRDKPYIHHTLFPGGFKSYPAEQAVVRHPTRLVEDAVRRMLPRTNLGRAMMKKLKVYGGDQHPHAAQKPTAVEARDA
ncbi:MAG: 50S ribosomal protein L13 [Myxococcales bacterium]